MDETIDLRPYVEALLRRWWVILGAVLGGILIAVFLHFGQSSYRATALVAVTDPIQRLQFDSRIVNTLDLDALLQVYPELAMSDSVMVMLLKQATELSAGEIDTLLQLHGMVQVETGSDPRLVRLIVRHQEPQLAADLANAWADTFVTVVDAIYRGQGGEATFFADQLAQTNSQLQTAEAALVEFQSGSRMGIVDNELLSLTNLQASYLADQRRLNMALDDIRALRAQIEAGTGDAVNLADQLTALMLQLNVYQRVSATPEPANGIQLQIIPQVDLTTSQRAEQLELLGNLAQSAETSLSEIDVRLLALEPRLFELQREKQDIFHQYEELNRNRNVAAETYMTLARKIDEVRIQTDDAGASLRVASRAEPPARPARSNLILTAAVAGLAGLLLAAALVIALTWWQQLNGRSAS